MRSAFAGLLSLTVLSAFWFPLAAQVFRTANAPPAEPPALATAAPRSYVVVPVQVPHEIPSTVPVSYQIESAGSVTVIGRTSGLVAAEGIERTILVTMGIPARAVAGRIIAAKVAFVAPGMQTLEVPVEVIVSPVHSLVIIAEDLAGVTAGSRVDFRYAVRNDGNTRESLRVTLTAPPGWRVPSTHTDQVLVVDPGAAEQRLARLSIPVAAGTGDFFVNIEAVGSHVHSSSITTIEVIDQGSRGAPLGPSLLTSIAAVAGGGALVSSVVAAHLNGPVSSTIRVDGRFAIATSDDPIAARGFTRVQSFAMTPSLRIWSPAWHLSAGNTTPEFTDLTGVNAWGTALAASYAHGKHLLGGIVAPRMESSGSSTEVYGVRYRATLGAFSLSSSATRLSENQLNPRELSAVGMGASLAELPVGTVAGEVAYRDYMSGGGFGWSAELHKDDDRNQLQLRYLHAPGGSSAFARAQDEVSASFSRALMTRWQVNGTFFAASDSNAILASMQSRSWSLNQDFQLSQSSSLNLDVRSSMFSADAATGAASFGSTENRATAGAAIRRGSMSYTAESGLESVSRNAEIEDGFTSDISGLRGILRGTAQLVTSNGVVQVEGDYDRSLNAPGILPNQLTLSARANQIRVSLPSNDVLVNGEAVYQSWGVARTASIILRAGVAVPLPRNVQISAHAEYNTFFDQRSTRSPLVFSLKVERGINLPRLRLSSSAGYVFQDLNDDGVRDIGEPGVGNVVVRHDGARAVTSRDGRYEFWERTRGVLVIEPSSLPNGFVLGAAASTGTVRGDIPVVPTGSVEVMLALAGQNTRATEVDLKRIAVMARDQQGRVWVARRSAETIAVFDALPPGEYALDFDSSALTDLLRAREPQTFRVDGRSSVRVTVPLIGRPLRFFQPQPPMAKHSQGLQSPHE